jgi:hypothetical protein
MTVRVTFKRSMMDRPSLNRASMDEVFRVLTRGRPGECIMIMSIGQWDALLQAAYDQGFVLWELDDNERPVAAYRRDGDREGPSDLCRRV